MPIPWLHDDDLSFPAVETALEDPDGLLAAGGDLTPARLLYAYSLGIFPWYNDDQPILWWSPNPRTVLQPSNLHLAKSFRKFLRKTTFECSINASFGQVMHHCRQSREQLEGSWISDDMEAAYNHLHQLGHAHSVEVWDKGELVGGLYGIAIGKVFFGESMFSYRSNASKLALHTLVQQLSAWDFTLIDCQVATDHLLSLGAQAISRGEFSARLATAVQAPNSHWPSPPINQTDSDIPWPI
ncbi:Leucyl/phenylalanyl-tRNA--protein transferase [Sinobacterium norvegicum]|uniref:Leucyl/phenylalanyl-tRNA--protein transferase n=1 Tax=Sinobacterium norvegicum TaxID=1641715 RepID=A0ABM9AAT5_9GAMM|nr:leucyl/phenylalanyl-tRNA--protein transferase [Sinobacterium norvegicum]CAH0990320.1 Leucyl/phenylalanyl-tRNA--protein transferase [Sinobacterium norvegicum]